MREALRQEKQEFLSTELDALSGIFSRPGLVPFLHKAEATSRLFRNNTHFVYIVNLLPD